MPEAVAPAVATVVDMVRACGDDDNIGLIYRDRTWTWADIVVVDAAGAECDAAVFDSDGRIPNADAAIGELVRRNGGGEFEGYWNNPGAEADRLGDC